MEIPWDASLRPGAAALRCFGCIRRGRLALFLPRSARQARLQHYKIHHTYTNPFGLGELRIRWDNHTRRFHARHVPLLPCLAFVKLWIVRVNDSTCSTTISLQPAAPIPGYASALFHDFHHKNFTGNYASTFTWWDAWYDTDAAFERFLDKRSSAGVARVPTRRGAAGRVERPPGPKEVDGAETCIHGHRGARSRWHLRQRRRARRRRLRGESRRTCAPNAILRSAAAGAIGASSPTSRASEDLFDGGGISRRGARGPFFRGVVDVRWSAAQRAANARRRAPCGNDRLVAVDARARHVRGARNARCPTRTRRPARVRAYQGARGARGARGQRAGPQWSADVRGVPLGYETDDDCTPSLLDGEGGPSRIFRQGRNL